MKLLAFIKSLFVKPPTVKPELPDLEPPQEVWYWQCSDYNCRANGQGTKPQVETDSTMHLLIHGHSVIGGIR